MQQASIPHFLRKLADELFFPIISFRTYSFGQQVMAKFRAVRIPGRRIYSLRVLARIFLQHALALLATPAAMIARGLGYRFVCVDLSQIGSIMWLDLYLRDITPQRIPRGRILVCRSPLIDANAYLFDLYAAHVTFVRSSLAQAILMPFFVNPLSRVDLHRYQEPFQWAEAFGDRGSFGFKAFRAYRAVHPDPLIHLPQTDLDRGKALMDALGVAGRPVIALHVRDSGYYRDTDRQTRNADIDTYLPALKKLCAEGYAVLRLGDANMQPIDHLVDACGDGLIDYARSDLKSAFADIYICATCDFFIGMSSGMLAMPIVFQKPACFINCVNASACLGYLPKTLATFKKVRRVADNGLVPLADLFRPPLNRNPSAASLAAEGVYLEDNSAQEILDTVVEFLRFDPEWTSDLQTKAVEMLGPYCHAYDAAGSFSNTILRAYADELGEPRTPTTARPNAGQTKETQS
ncbi:MAG: TIGR04372 family glycosyltransferase [Rhodospirillales bacterium]